MADKLITNILDDDYHFGYDFIYSINHAPKNDDEFRLHHHDDRYEIVLFLRGNAQFHAEGNVYESHPHDIYMAVPMEMHHNVFLSSAPYERIMLHLKLDYFEKNNVHELEKVFCEKPLGQKSQIPASIANQELYPLLIKMNRYLNEGAYNIANCVLLEFLYLLNHIGEPLTEPASADPLLQQILIYINENLSEPLSLDMLADRFFIDKYHLCRIFKKITGHTIKQYIIKKRLLLVQDYHQKGQTLLEASINAGFNSYAHFYKMYKQVYQKAPGKLKGRKS